MKRQLLFGLKICSHVIFSSKKVTQKPFIGKFDTFLLLKYNWTEFLTN